jgi:hypothetical protein
MTRTAVAVTNWVLATADGAIGDVVVAIPMVHFIVPLTGGVQDHASRR